MSEFVRGAQRGCLRSLSIRLLSVLIVVPLACLFVFLPLILVTRFEMSVWVLLISSALFLLIIFGGGGGWAALTIYRRARQLDALFVPLGLSGSPYQLFFRQYHGRIGDRHVSVYFYRGPTLDVEVDTSLQTRLAVTGRDVDNTFFSQLFSKEPLQLQDEELGDLMVFALDEEWSRQLLAAGNVPSLLHRLLRFEGPFVRRHVALGPGRLRQRLFGNRNLFRFEIDPEEAAQWVHDLLTLVKTAERLPGPEVPAEETGAERLAASVRQTNPNAIIAVTVAAVLLAFGCAAAVGVAAFLWVSAQ
jgi:hypothetical protein